MSLRGFGVLQFWSFFFRKVQFLEIFRKFYGVFSENLNLKAGRVSSSCRELLKSLKKMSFKRNF